METTPKPQTPALTKPTFITMAQMEPGTRVTMHLRVDSVKIIRQRTRYGGDQTNQVAECIVGDEHGCVNLMAFDE